MPYMGLFLLLVMAITLIDVIRTDDALIRGLPKIAWVLLVVFIPLVGAIAWIAVGRPTADDLPRRDPQAGAFPEYERPGRHVAADPEADRVFLEQVRARAEEQRRKGREQRAAQDRRDADPE
ncbi:PLDc_N domain-containing protein [Gordonia sp. X0973]|uniref:PLD nuclease N-terminal domain-containing protein n=1 Tax=Gordonia sp. X0973 TaxID=2742602 RepID=UPI000F5298C9|nr:PLD nuclease N-terminal domain-containing protein [Gordonia sp. X0973]QKT06906.1 PLDc_N domain-containing protein [Gordonia sp. X0973]